MRRDWETRLVGELEHNSRMKTCAEISKEATLGVTKEEPILEKLEEEHIKSRTTPSIDFAKSNETNKRSMSSAKPLREFEDMDWVPIDYGELFDERRPFPNQKGMARALETDFPPEKKVEHSYDLETTSEIFQKLFGDDEVDPEHIAEVKRIMGIKPEASPYARLTEVYAIGSEEE
jgi:DNA-binding Lrp family transcriptional regulator